MGQLWGGLLASPLLLCIALLLGVVASVSLLPCGGNITLLPSNASHQEFVLRDCVDAEDETVVYIRNPLSSDNDSNMFINTTVLVLHSTNVWVQLLHTHLVNVTVLFDNVTYSPRHKCATLPPLGTCGQGLIVLGNSSAVTSAFTLSRINTTTSISLMTLQASNTTDCKMTLQSIEQANASVGDKTGVYFHQSHVQGCNVTLRGMDVALKNADVLTAKSSVWRQVHLFLLDSTLVAVSNGNASAPWIFSAIGVADGLVTDSSVSIRNVLLRGDTAASEQRQYMTVQNTTVAAAQVWMDSIHATNAILLSTQRSTWSNTTVALYTFVVLSSEPRGSFECVAAVGTSAMRGVTLLQSHGVVVSDVSTTNVYGTNLFCVANSSVALSSVRIEDLSLSHHIHTTTTAPTLPDDVLWAQVSSSVGCVILYNSTVATTTMELANVQVAAVVGVLAVQLANVSDVNVMVHSSNMSTIRGTAMVLVSQWHRSALHVSATNLSAHARTFSFERSSLDNTTLMWTACKIHATAESAFLVLQSTLTESILMWQHSQLTAHNKVVFFQTQHRTVAVVVALTNCTVIADSHVAFGTFDTSWHNSSNWSLRDCSFRAGYNALGIQRSDMTQFSFRLVQSTVLTETSLAVFLLNITWIFSEVVLETSLLAVYSSAQPASVSSMAFLSLNSSWVRTHVSITNCTVFADRNAWVIERTNISGSSSVRFTDCSLSASADNSYAYNFMTSVVEESSVVFSGTVLLAGFNTLQVENVTFLLSSFELWSCNATAVFSNALTLLHTNLTSAVVDLRTTVISAVESYACRVSFLTSLNSNVSIVNSNLSTTSDFAFLLSESTLSASCLVLQSARITASSYVFRIDDSAVNNATVKMEDVVLTAIKCCGLFLLRTEVVASTVILVRAQVMVTTGDAFRWERLSIHTTTVSLRGSNISSALGFAYYMASVNLTTSALTLDTCKITAHAKTMQLEKTTALGSSLSLERTDVSAVDTLAVFFLEVNWTAGSILLRTVHVQAMTKAFVIETTSISFGNASLVGCRISATASHGVLLLTSHVRSSHFVLVGCSLHAETMVLLVQQTTLSASELDVSDTSIFATASDALCVFFAVITTSRVSVIHCSIEASGNALRLEQASLITSDLFLVESNVSASSAFGFLFLDTNASASCTFLIQRSTIGAETAFAFRLERVVWKESRIALLDGSVSSPVYAWYATRTVFANSSVELHGTLMVSSNYTFLVQDSRAVSSNTTCRDCSIAAGSSSALGFLDTNMTSCIIDLHGASLYAAATVAFSMQGCHLEALVLLLYNAVVEASDSYAFRVGLTILHGCRMDVYFTYIAAGSAAFFVDKTTAVRSNITLTESGLDTRRTNTLYFSSVNFSVCRIVVDRSWMAAGINNVFVLDSATLADSTSISLQQSNISVSGAYGIALSSTAVLSSTVELQTVTIVAGTFAVRVDASELHMSAVLFADCLVYSSSSRAMVVSNTNASSVNVFVQRTLIAAGSYAVALIGSQFVSVNASLADASVFVTTTFAIYAVDSTLASCDVDVRDVVVGAHSYAVFIARAVVRASSNVSLRNSSVSAETYGCVLFEVVVSGKSVVKLQHVRVSVSGSRALHLERFSMQSGSSLLLVKSLFLATISHACYILDYDIAAGSDLRMSEVTLVTQSLALLLQRGVVQNASFLTIDGSNLSASDAQGVVCIEGNLSSSTLLLSGTEILAPYLSFVLQQTSASASNLTVYRCRIAAASAFAFYATQIRFKKTIVRFEGSSVQADVLTNFLAQSDMYRTSILFLDCHLQSSAHAWNVSMTVVADSSNITFRRTTVTGEYAVVYLASGTSLAASSIVFIECNLSLVSGHVLSMIDVNASAVALSAEACSIAAEGFLYFTQMAHAASIALRIFATNLSTGGPVLMFDDSDVHISALNVVASTLTRVSGGGVLSPREETAVVVTSGSGSHVEFHAVIFDAVALVGFHQVFRSNATELVRLRSMLVYCSWWAWHWTYSDGPAKQRPISKLHLGAVLLTHQLPQFFLYSAVAPDANCGVLSLSHSTTSSQSKPTLSASSSLRASSSHTTAITQSYVVSVSATGTLSHVHVSATASFDSTASRVAVERAVRYKQRLAVDSFAAAIGSAIAGASFIAASSGLLAQRVAFVLRNTKVSCGSLDTTSSNLEDSASASLDWLSSPTRLDVGDLVGAAHRGAVLGNVAVCATAAAVAAVVVLLMARATGQRSDALLTRLHVRQAVSIPVVVLLQPTFASAVALLQLAVGSAAHRDAETVGVGVLGAVFAVAGIAAAAYLLDPRAAMFRARADALPRVTLQRQARDSDPDADGCPSVAAVYRWWVAESVAWRPRAGHAAFVAEWGFLFDELCARRQWWPLADAAVSLAMAGLDAAVAGGGSGCVAAKWAVVAVACAAVLALLLLVPLNSRRAQWSAVAIAALVALIALLGVLEADDAVIRALGIVAVALQWCPTLFLLSERCTSLGRSQPLTVVPGSVEVTPKDEGCAPTVPLTSSRKTHRTSVQGNQCNRAGIDPVGLLHAATQASDGEHDGSNRTWRLSAGRAWRQRAALQALVALICSEQHRTLLALSAAQH